MNRILAVVSLFLFMVIVPMSNANATTYTYVGSWHVGDGPVWTSNPLCSSGIEVAALLFGGNASDYAISTISTDTSTINFKTYLDGWGNTQYLITPAAQDYKLQTGSGYNDPFGGPSFSAYVLDHTEGQRYGDPSLTGDQLNDPYINYAFIVDQSANPVPEPSTFLLLGAGLAGVGFLRRRAKK
jgi:hypothetical protein